MKVRKLRIVQKPGWTAPLQLYIIRCDRHGLVFNYPQGHDELLDCPVCAGMTR